MEEILEVAHLHGLETELQEGTLVLKGARPDVSWVANFIEQRWPSIRFSVSIVPSPGPVPA